MGRDIQEHRRPRASKIKGIGDKMQRNPSWTWREIWKEETIKAWEGGSSGRKEDLVQEGQRAQKLGKSESPRVTLGEWLSTSRSEVVQAELVSSFCPHSWSNYLLSTAPTPCCITVEVQHTFRFRRDVPWEPGSMRCSCEHTQIVNNNLQFDKHGNILSTRLRCREIDLCWWFEKQQGQHILYCCLLAFDGYDALIRTHRDTKCFLLWSEYPVGLTDSAERPFALW